MAKDILNISCPGCGAPAEFDIVRQIYACRYCGGTVELEKAKQDKAQFQAAIRKKNKESAGKYPLMTTTCTGCGATLVFEENEAVTTCDFCERKLVRKKFVGTEDVPTAVIPFAVTRKEAIEKLRAWCGENKSREEAQKLLPELENLGGYYLPYHMTRGPVSCEVRQNHAAKFSLARGYLHDEFVNCSDQFDNLVLDAMEPYDLADLKEFDYAYVAGQRMKITDIPEKEANRRLNEEVRENYRVFFEKIWETKSLGIITKVDPVVQSPVLLPVYYLKKGDLIAAVNGQTGKVSVKELKRHSYLSVPWWVGTLAVLLLALGMVFGITMLATGNLTNAGFFTGVLGVFYLIVFAAMFGQGFDNKFSVSHYRNILTSGEQTFRREKGKLIPRDEVLKRKIAEPVFMETVDKQEIPVTYAFQKKRRIVGILILGMVMVFLPVIIALFINGFNFAGISLGGSAVWFCIAVPTVPIIMSQVGFQEIYNSPRLFVTVPDGSRKKKRVYKDGQIKPGKTLLTVLAMCLHPIGWIVIAVIALMVYLTAF